MRYWKLDPGTLAQTADDVDLAVLEPDVDWVELADAAAYDAAAAAIVAALPPPPAAVVTPLRGNGVTHTTNADARRVSITILAPIGGVTAGRPHINGTSVAGTSGGAPYVFDRPGELLIETKAGNNDLLIVEEF